MKKLLLILSILPVICFGQKSPVTYTGVKEISATKEELLNKAQVWLNKNSNDVKPVSSEGLASNSSFMYNSKIFYGNLGTKGVVKYKMFITVKDGKYKYELTQFVHEGNANNSVNLSFGLITEDEECPYHLKGQRKGWENKVWTELKEKVEKKANDVIASLSKEMETKNDF